MALYQTQPDRKLRAKALAKEYGIGGHSHDFLDGSRGFVNHDWKGLEFDHYPDHQKITLKFIRVTDEERNRILDKMYGMGIHSLSAYIRKMALDGYCLNLDLPQLRRMAYLLQNCSNNLNQYAKRANECGKVYAADMEDLRQRLDELIDIGKQILSKLAEL